MDFIRKLKDKVSILEAKLKLAENCLLTVRDFNGREDRKRIIASYFEQVSKITLVKVIKENTDE